MRMPYWDSSADVGVVKASTRPASRSLALGQGRRTLAACSPWSSRTRSPSPRTCSPRPSSVHSASSTSLPRWPRSSAWRRVVAPRSTCLSSSRTASSCGPNTTAASLMRASSSVTVGPSSLGCWLKRSWAPRRARQGRLPTTGRAGTNSPATCSPRHASIRTRTSRSSTSPTTPAVPADLDDSERQLAGANRADLSERLFWISWRDVEAVVGGLGPALPWSDLRAVFGRISMFRFQGMRLELVGPLAGRWAYPMRQRRGGAYPITARLLPLSGATWTYLRRAAVVGTLGRRSLPSAFDPSSM